MHALGNLSLIADYDKFHQETSVEIE